MLKLTITIEKPSKLIPAGSAGALAIWKSPIPEQLLKFNRAMHYVKLFKQWRSFLKNEPA